jgi:hypothetical protein
MLSGTTILAHALTGMSITVVPQTANNPVPAIVLPSDGMRAAIYVITLSQFEVIPGPQFEGVLHGALFRSTEHLYDL